MSRGLTTVVFSADDLPVAEAWYMKLLGIEPYFVREVDEKPAYIESRIGDYQHELEFLDGRFAGPAGSVTAIAPVTYWAVDDVHAAFDRLIALGATAHEQATERGPGFVSASVVDPFGNLLGVTYNQHYLDVLASKSEV